MAPELPTDWRVKPLSRLGAFHKGRGGPKRDDQDVGVPVVRYGELYTKHHEVIRDFFTFVSSDRAEDYTPLCSGDLLFAGAGETVDEIGKSAVFLGPEPAYTSGDTVIFRPDGEVDPLFLGYASNGSAAKAHKRSVGQGSSILHIYARDLETLELAVPPLSEQGKIAAILSSVDDAIAATRRVIEQTKRVKQGLLQTLMTSGIGHTRFKRTEIGEIPVTWKVRAISSVGTVAYGVTVNQARRQSPDRLPLLTVAAHDLDEGWKLESISEIGALEGDRAKYAAEPGDVLLVEGNGNPDLLGRPLIWDGRIPEVLHQNHLIRVRSPSTEPEWIALALSAREARQQISDQAKSSSGLYTINSTVIKALRIPIASARERRNIISIMKCHDHALAENQAVLAALQKTKRGLMQDLLTGRVRVQTA